MKESSRTPEMTRSQSRVVGRHANPSQCFRHERDDHVVLTIGERDIDSNLLHWRVSS
jgi:hypothetical protein